MKSSKTYCQIVKKDIIVWAIMAALLLSACIPTLVIGILHLYINDAQKGINIAAVIFGSLGIIASVIVAIPHSIKQFKHLWHINHVEPFKIKLMNENETSTFKNNQLESDKAKRLGLKTAKSTGSSAQNHSENDENTKQLGEK